MLYTIIYIYIYVDIDIPYTVFTKKCKVAKSSHHPITQAKHPKMKKDLR